MGRCKQVEAKISPAKTLKIKLPIKIRAVNMQLFIELFFNSPLVNNQKLNIAANIQGS